MACQINILTTFLVGIETWKESPAKTIRKSMNATGNIKIRIFSLLAGRCSSAPGTDFSLDWREASLH
jgi:hypothetical protein